MSALHATTFAITSTTSGVEVDTWNGTGASRNATGGRLGQGSLKILNPSTGVRTGIAMRFTVSAPTNATFHCFYLTITTAPNVNTTIAKLHDTVTLASDITPEIGLRLNTDRTLTLTDGSGTAIGSNSSALTIGVTYRIEFEEDGSGAGGTNVADGRINGSSFASTTTGSYSGGYTTLRLGANMLGETCTTGQWEISDVVCHNASGSTQNTWPGDGALAYCLPDAAGDNAEGAAGGSAPAATGWQSVNSNPPADATTFWELQTDSSAGSGNPDRLDVSIAAFPAAANTPASVEWVAVGVRQKPLTNAACSFVPRVKSAASGTVAEGTTTSITGTAFTTHDDTATSRQYKLIRTTDPSTAGAWGVDPSNWQIGVRAPDGNPNVDVSGLWALVRLVPGSPPPPPPPPGGTSLYLPLLGVG